MLCDVISAAAELMVRALHSRSAIAIHDGVGVVALACETWRNSVPLVSDVHSLTSVAVTYVAPLQVRSVSGRNLLQHDITQSKHGVQQP
jgi:hypothetical protein